MIALDSNITAHVREHLLAIITDPVKTGIVSVLDIAAQARALPSQARSGSEIANGARAQIDARPGRRRDRTVAGDDIDHAEKGIRSIGGRIRTANDFDALDLFERHGEAGPVRATIEIRRVDRTAIDQHLHLVRIFCCQAMVADDLTPTAFLCHLHPGHQTQQPAKIPVAAPANHFRIDHGHRARRILERLRQT